MMSLSKVSMADPYHSACAGGNPDLVRTLLLQYEETADLLENEACGWASLKINNAVHLRSDQT